MPSPCFPSSPPSVFSALQYTVRGYHNTLQYSSYRTVAVYSIEHGSSRTVAMPAIWTDSNRVCVRAHASCMVRTFERMI